MSLITDNLFLLNEALADTFSRLHRLYKAGPQYVTAYVRVDAGTNTFDVDVAILAGPAQRIELLSQADTEALIKFAEVKRLVLDWNGDIESYPLPASDVDDTDEFYNFGDEEQ